MTVSVIIPCYNQGQYLSEAIESVIQQYDQDTELIVVNDGSTDNTEEVALRYDCLTYVSQSNKGPSAARNNGFSRSNGDFIIFLDADDRLPPGAVDAGLNALESTPKAAMAYGRMQVISADGTYLHIRHEPDHRDDYYKDLLIKCYIPTPGMVMFRRSCLEKCGLFDPNFIECNDYEIYLRIAREQSIVSHPHVTVERRLHKNMMTGNPGRMLSCVLRVHRREWRHVCHIPDLRSTYREGRVAWRSYYGNELFREMKKAVSDRRILSFFYHSYFFMRYCPQFLWYLVAKPKSYH